MKASCDSPSSLSPKFGPIIMDASSIGCIAHSLLKDGEEGNVAGVFNKAVNVSFPEGFLSLVPEAVQRGPINVTLRMSDWHSKVSSLGLRDGDKVRVRGSTLELSENLKVRLDSAEIYSPELKFMLPMLTDNEIETNLEVVRKVTLLFGNMAGLGELISLTMSEETDSKACDLNIFASYALPRIIRFEEAFRTGKQYEIKDAVTELIGIGPGLTPSSDDMLGGLMLLCILYSKNRGLVQHPSQRIAQAISSEARGRTTGLSEEYLRQAASGRGNEPIMRLCTALLTERQESVERETKRVLEIGETSGTDMVLGIVLGAMLCIGTKFNYH